MKNVKLRKELKRLHWNKLREKKKNEKVKDKLKKYNLLLTQTELYSHFVGRKIKTSELEGNESTNNTGKIADEIDWERTNAIRTSMYDVNFDNEDDEQLRQKSCPECI